MSEVHTGAEQNFLADYAGIEFECSIAAAELNKNIHKQIIEEKSFSYKSNEKSVFIVGSYANKADVYQYNTNANYEFNDETLPIVVIQPRTSPSAEIEPSQPVEPKRRWLSMKIVQIEQISPATKHDPVKPDVDPILGVLFGDVIVPVATFAQRLDSDACSYVQLGSEMSGDNVFSTQLDEGTSRNELVESLRNIELGYSSNSFTLPSSVINLISSEIDRNNPELQRMLLLDIQRLAHERLSNSDWTKEGYYMIKDGGRSSNVTLKLQPLSNNYTVSDGKSISLSLYEEFVDGQKRMAIGALYRNRVMLPLISFFSDGTLPVLERASAYPKVESLRTLQKILNGTALAEKQIFHKQDKKNHAYLYAESIGLVQNFHDGKFGDSPIGKIHIESAKANQFMKYLSGFIDAPKFVKALKDTGTIYSELFTELGVDEVSGDLPISSETNERLLNIIGYLANKNESTLLGNINDMQIGKTVGGLDFKIELFQESLFVRMRVLSRPSAMPQEVHKPMFDHTFDFNAKVDMP